MARPSKWLKALIQPLLKADIPLVIKLASGHTANALEVQSSAGVVLASIGADGAIAPAIETALDGTFKIANTADATKAVDFDVSGVTAGQTRTLTPPDYDGTLATRAGTETLTNKTLTSPKVGTAILDTNGLELLKVTATATAVNELTLANAAADGAPTVSATGDDTHIGIKIAPKGAQGRLLVTTAILKGQVASALNTASNLTYTAAQVLGGLVLRDCNGDNRADIVPAAADLVADLPGAVAGMAFDFALRNSSDAAETITVTAPGADVTISGTATVAQNNTKLFRLVLTNVGTGTEAYTLYSLGTLVH